MATSKKLRIAALFTVILCGIVFLYLLYQVVSNEKSYQPAAADAILVLGHSISAEDATPDDWLEARLETALRLYHEQYAAKLIVSGGKGPGDEIPVARAMADWFIARGVPAARLLIEDRSGNTAENFSFSKDLAEAHGIAAVLVVTNDFHLYRSMMIASDYFASCFGCGAPIPFDCNKALAYLKEPLSIIKYKGSRLFG